MATSIESLTAKINAMVNFHQIEKVHNLHFRQQIGFSFLYMEWVACNMQNDSHSSDTYAFLLCINAQHFESIGLGACKSCKTFMRSPTKVAIAVSRV